MSYSVISTANTTGARRYYKTGLGGVCLGWAGLGSTPDFDTLSELQNAGWDQARLQILVQLGATNEQLLALPFPASDDEMTSAYNALALQLSTPSAPPTPAPPASPSQSSGNVLRAGSQLSYTATWGRSTATVFKSGSFWNDPNGVQSAIQNVLSQQWGIVIDSQFHTSNDLINTTGQSGFTLQVHTTRDYGTAGDVKGIIDGAIYNLGLSLQYSAISLTVTGVTPVVTGSPAGAVPSSAATVFQTPTNWSAWFQQNTGTLVFGLAAVVVLSKLIRRL